jgi:hypothetical protein
VSLEPARDGAALIRAACNTTSNTEEPSEKDTSANKQRAEKKQQNKVDKNKSEKIKKTYRLRQ